MEQSKFILEVQSRQCLWNPRVEAYFDRYMKRQAWKEIAAKMYRNFNSCSENEKWAKVTELQKKWKSLSDYYKRRNPNKDIDKKTKQKKPVVELLQFLEKNTKFNRSIRTHQRIAERIMKTKKSKKMSNENQPSKVRNTRKKDSRCSKTRLENNLQQKKEIKFLQSLLPVMQSLNDRQRFEFKLEVMLLIKKIKYNNVKDTFSNIYYINEDNNAKTETHLIN